MKLGGGFKHLLFCSLFFFISSFFKGVVQPPHRNMLFQLHLLNFRALKRQSKSGGKKQKGAKKLGTSPKNSLQLKKQKGCSNQFGCWTKNNRKTPQIINFNRVFHYKPSIWGGTPIFGNTHLVVTVIILEGGVAPNHTWNHQFINGIFRDPLRTWDPRKWSAGPILFPNPTPMFESLKIWEACMGSIP